MEVQAKQPTAMGPAQWFRSRGRYLIDDDGVG